MGWLAGLRNRGGAVALKSTAESVRLSFVSRPNAQIWAIGGGKGGVGKSLLTSNFGVFLAGLQNKVLLVDADLGAANLHTFIRAEDNKFSLSNFLISGEGDDLDRLISKTSVPNLDIISGARDSLDTADFGPSRVQKLFSALKKVEYDYVLLDIGPGTSSGNLDLFIKADRCVLVTTPEPTSIENTYRFLKCLYSRRMKSMIQSSNGSGLRGLLSRVLYADGKPQTMSYADIFTKLENLDPEWGRRLKAHMDSNKISIVVNQVKRDEDNALGASMQKACHDYFGLCIDYLGCVLSDESVGDSIRYRKPLAVYYKSAVASKDIEECLRRLIKC